MQIRTQPRALTLAVGVAVPLALLGIAYAAWAISDRLVQIGPLDRAQFAWLVVVPLLTVTPIATGLAWRRLSTRQIWFAALVVAAIVGTVVGVFYALAIVGSTHSCESARLSGGDIAFATSLTAIIAGGGYAASGAASALLVRQRRPYLAALAGASGGFATFWLAALAGFMAMGPVGICNRPPLV